MVHCISQRRGTASQRSNSLIPQNAGHLTDIASTHWTHDVRPSRITNAQRSLVSVCDYTTCPRGIWVTVHDAVSWSRLLSQNSHRRAKQLHKHKLHLTINFVRRANRKFANPTYVDLRVWGISMFCRTNTNNSINHSHNAGFFCSPRHAVTLCPVFTTRP